QALDPSFRMPEPALMMEADVSLNALTALGMLRFPELALSAYLPTDQGAGRNYYRALLDDLARADRHKLTKKERATLQRALLERRGCESPVGVVCAGRPHESPRSGRLAEPVPGRISVAGLFDLAPIRLQLFEHPPALAVVVDKRQARLYTLVLDELAEVG